MSAEETQVREHLEALARALRAKDIASLMPHYSPDVAVFDLLPLQTLGADAYRKNFAAWFAAVQGPIDYEMRDLRVQVCGDVAFCHYLGHVRATRTSGQNNDYQVRVTASLRKTNGRWLVTHEHISLPFRSPQAMQAALA